MTEEDFEKLVQQDQDDYPEELSEGVLTRIRLHESLQALLLDIDRYVPECEVETRGLRDRLVGTLRSPEGTDSASRMGELLYAGLKGDGHENPNSPGYPGFQERIDAQYPGVTARLEGGLSAPWVIQAQGEKAIENLVKYLRAGMERTSVPDFAKEQDKYEFMTQALSLIDEGRAEDVQALIKAREWAIQGDATPEDG